MAFSFGATAATPAPASGGFSFGANPAAAPAPSAFSFGAASTPASTPAASGFSFGAPASTAPAPAPSAFSFGTNTAATAAPALGGSSLFGTSGATAGSTTSLFGTPGATAGSTTSLFGTPGATSATHAAVVKSDTPYEKLPPAHQQMINEIWKQMTTQRQAADVIEKADSDQLSQLHKSINSLNQLVLKVEALQQSEGVASLSLKEDAKKVARDAEQHGVWSLHQILQPSGMRLVEELPSRVMWECVQLFEGRLKEYAARIKEIEQQLFQKHGSQTVNGPDTAGGPYGQRNRVSPEQLAQIVLAQNEAFMRIAGLIAAIHEKVDRCRNEYKATYREDPFIAADRAEAEAERRAANKLRQQQLSTGHQAALGQPGAAPVTGVTPGTTSLFGQPTATPGAAPTSNIFGGGTTSLFGSTPAPAPATGGLFGAAPAPAPALFGASTSPFAAKAASPFGASAPAFGAAPAATPGLFGRSNSTSSTTKSKKKGSRKK